MFGWDAHSSCSTLCIRCRYTYSYVLVTLMFTGGSANMEMQAEEKMMATDAINKESVAEPISVEINDDSEE